MSEKSGEVKRVPATRTIWLLCCSLVVCAGCSQRPTSPPFHRFVEDVAPGDRWHETKVCIADETRNLLVAPYRSRLRKVEVELDGTVLLGAVADMEQVSAEAVGIRICVAQRAAHGGGRKGDEPHYVYFALPPATDAGTLAAMKVQVLPAGDTKREAGVWAREVIPLPQEYVTKTVRVPPSARLDFGIALEDDNPQTGVRFDVSVDDGRTRRSIFSQMLDPLSADYQPGWVDVSVDVSEFAGSRVRFVFRTEDLPDRKEANNGSKTVSLSSAAWSSPLLYSTERSDAGGRPNIILICLDTLRADHLGCYGYHRDTSPNIDRFAEGAFLFEKAIAPSSWTLPSHASLFTGLHPSVHLAGIWVPPRFGPPIQESERTLAELAREQGYLTAAYTEGVWVRALFGFAQGFEVYSDGKGRMAKDAETTFNDATEWLGKYSRMPFFLFVHTYQTHTPYTPRGRFATMFDSDYTGSIGTTEALCRPQAATSDADRIHIEALYDGEIAYTDEVVGNFLAKLADTGLLHNTVVFIFSDHGEEFWEHEGYGHGKTVYDESLQVPLIIRLAGEHPPTGAVARQVSLTDLYATVNDLLSIDHNSPPDCMSLLPLMGVNESAQHYDRKFVVSGIIRQTLSRTAQGETEVTWRRRSVRTDGEKYVRTGTDQQVEELYDLQADPGEKNDIAARNQPRLDHYRELLASFLERVAAGRTPLEPGQSKSPLLTEEDKRRLKALGYL